MFEEEKNSQNQILHIFAYLPLTMKLLKFKMFLDFYKFKTITPPALVYNSTSTCWASTPIQVRGVRYT